MKLPKAEFILYERTLRQNRGAFALLFSKGHTYFIAGRFRNKQTNLQAIQLFYLTGCN